MIKANKKEIGEVIDLASLNQLMSDTSDHESGKKNMSGHTMDLPTMFQKRISEMGGRLTSRANTPAAQVPGGGKLRTFFKGPKLL